MLRLLAALCLWLTALAALGQEPGMAVITNRSAAAISFRVSSSTARDWKLEAGDVTPIMVGPDARLLFESAGQRRSYELQPGKLYYFGNVNKTQVAFHEIGLSAPAAHRALRPALVAAGNAGAAEPAMPTVPKIIIPVKILYDQDELTRREVWEQRLRKRFEEASRIFRKHCFVEFKVVAVDTWSWDASTVDLEQALGQFERTVDPSPARIAIGFTGQNRRNVKYVHLGGTRGPLHSHMLVREWVNSNSEAERLEVLVHELGHFLGAVHSPEPNSVMRTILGDRQARSVKFRIVFDPLNTMSMCLVSRELAQHPDVQFSAMAPATQDELRRIYYELTKAMPGDNSGLLYMRKLGQPQVEARDGASPQ